MTCFVHQLLSVNVRIGEYIVENNVWMFAKISAIIILGLSTQFLEVQPIVVEFFSLQLFSSKQLHPASYFMLC